MGMTMSFIMGLIMIEVVSDDELLECVGIKMSTLRTTAVAIAARAMIQPCLSRLSSWMMSSRSWKR